MKLRNNYISLICQFNKKINKHVVQHLNLAQCKSWVILPVKKYNMKRIKLRSDLMSKSQYSKIFNKARPIIDKMIEDGELAVEEISGKHYIKI